jgi:hypothetical protein
MDCLSEDTHITGGVEGTVERQQLANFCQRQRWAGILEVAEDAGYPVIDVSRRFRVEYDV